MAIDEAALNALLEGDATHPGKVDKVSGKGLSTNDYTTEEKLKLNGIEAGANHYVLPVAKKDALGGVKTISAVSDSSGFTPVPIIGGIPYYRDTTYKTATPSADGLMSADDKAKLNRIAAGANNYELPTASPAVKGGIRIGDNLAVSGDTVSVPVMEGATTQEQGKAGIVPAPQANEQAFFLRGDGSWQPANNYVLPPADENNLGGVRIGEGLAVNGGKLTAPLATDTNRGTVNLPELVHTEDAVYPESMRYVPVVGNFEGYLYARIPFAGEQMTDGHLASGMMNAEDKAKLDAISVFMTTDDIDAMMAE